MHLHKSFMCPMSRRWILYLLSHSAFVSISIGVWGHFRLRGGGDFLPALNALHPQYENTAVYSTILENIYYVLSLWDKATICIVDPAFKERIQLYPSTEGEPANVGKNETSFLKHTEKENVCRNNEGIRDWNIQTRMKYLVYLINLFFFKLFIFSRIFAARKKQIFRRKPERIYFY